MEEIEVTEDQREALVALLDAAREYPEADGFEHDRSAVVMPGARHDVRLNLDREAKHSADSDTWAPSSSPTSGTASDAGGGPSS